MMCEFYKVTPYYDCCNGSIFNLTEIFKKKILFLLRYYKDEIITTLKHHFYMGKKFFKLFCIEKDFPKYLEKFRNLFIETFCFPHSCNSLK